MLWDAKHLLLLLLCIGVTFTSGKFIARTKNIKVKKAYLIGCVIGNIGILGIFKYYNFFIDSLQKLFDKLSLNFELTYLNILVPIGISFYIFRALSYTIDVYRGTMDEAKHLGKYALAISFFPQIVSGPIERPNNFLNQIDNTHKFDERRIIEGFQLILIGLFKKVVIADRLALMVNTVYNDIYSYSGQAYIVATIFFTFQIYFDFSAYSDMAIGCARTLGYDLNKNFNRPYLAKSIAEFWNRWHISLSVWFRDYLYIPLGGNRRGSIRWGINILVVFLISGLWHGAEWTFIFWGAIHGGLQIIEKAVCKLIEMFEFKKYKIRLKPLYLTVLNFLLISFSWICFRANNLNNACHIIRNLFFFRSDFNLFELGITKPDFILVIILIILFAVIEILQEYFKINIKDNFARLPLAFKWGTYIFTIMFIVLFGLYGSLTEKSFIYMQF